MTEGTDSTSTDAFDIGTILSHFTDGFWGYLQSEKIMTYWLTHSLNNIGLRYASASKNERFLDSRTWCVLSRGTKKATPLVGMLWRFFRFFCPKNLVNLVKADESGWKYPWCHLLLWCCYPIKSWQLWVIYLYWLPSNGGSNSGASRCSIIINAHSELQMEKKKMQGFSPHSLEIQ